MLNDPKAVDIISRAKQKNVAAAQRNDDDFAAIFEAFFNGLGVTGHRVMDLGPGQYDFARRMRDLGATAVNVDRDPAVLELGAYLGFETIEAQLKQFDTERHAGSLDGLFCKFSVNAMWYDEPEQVADAIAALDGMLKPGGWGWIAPWNGVPKKHPPSEAHVAAMLKAQVDAFGRCGWRGWNLTDALARRWGVNGHVANHALFLKHIDPPAELAEATPFA